MFKGEDKAVSKANDFLYEQAKEMAKERLNKIEKP